MMEDKKTINDLHYHSCQAEMSPSLKGVCNRALILAPVIHKEDLQKLKERLKEEIRKSLIDHEAGNVVWKIIDKEFEKLEGEK